MALTIFVLADLRPVQHVSWSVNQFSRCPISHTSARLECLKKMCNPLNPLNSPSPLPISTITVTPLLSLSHGRQLSSAVDAGLRIHVMQILTQQPWVPQVSKHFCLYSAQHTRRNDRINMCLISVLFVRKCDVLHDIDTFMQLNYF